MLWGKMSDPANTLKKCYVNSDANWPRFTTLLKKAISACREECPQAKVVIHTERVAQNEVLKSFYDKMSSYGVDYDIIGLSYYPYYHGSLTVLEGALNKMEANFPEKEIMLVETGYYHDWQPNDVTYDLSYTYPISGEGQKAFTEALIAKLNTHEKVTGLFWWFMEANEHGLDWNTQRVTDKWYNAGLFDNQTGKAEPAIKVLKDFLGQDGIEALPVSYEAQHSVYTLDGRSIERPTTPGLYIIDGKKQLIRR
jgi:arabinogalactan endo-1,4-beta-galactosidase